MDRKYFDSILITISDHAKYEITESITHKAELDSLSNQSKDK